MCDPVSATVVGSTVLSAGSSILGGRKAKKAAAAAAAAEEAAAQDEAKLIRKAARRVRGEATAAYAGSGVDVSQGTPLIIDRQITEDSELDAQNTIISGQRRGAAIRAGGSAAAAQGYAQAAATVLQTAGSWGGGWKKAPKKAGT